MAQIEQAQAIDATIPWYRTLNREQWRVLVASNLGWLFDGFEIYAIFLTVGFALRQLLDPSQYSAIPQYAGYILAGTVAGWATGGVKMPQHFLLSSRARTLTLASVMRMRDEEVERVFKAAASTGRPSSLSRITSSSDFGRGRLPTCVVSIR